MAAKLTLTEDEWRLREEFRRDWHAFCDADPVAPDFTERTEAAGLIKLVPATGNEAEEDIFWTAKYGFDPPTSVWVLTDAGRQALSLKPEDGP